MPTSSTRGRGGCLRLLSCWTGCFGSILPCLAAKPLSMPQEPAMQAINVDISMPIRRSFTTEEEYQERDSKFRERKLQRQNQAWLPQVE